MVRISVFGVCIVFLLSVTQPSVANQWPSGDWNTEVIFIGDYIHRMESGATNDGDMFFIKAGGHDIGGRADQFTYVYKEVSGDFEVWATVYTLEQTDYLAKAGIMARQGLNTGAKNVMMARTGGNELMAFQWREVVNSDSYGILTSDEILRPVTLRLIRRGNQFTGGWSLDFGKTWKQNMIPSVTVEMRDPILIGIAVTSHAVGTLTTATVEVNPPPPSQTLPEGTLVTIETERTVNMGDTFTAAVNISDIGGDSAGVGIQLMRFLLHISFDPDILEVVDGGVKEGTLLPSVGPTYWIDPDVDNTSGNITSIESGLTGERGPDVGGTLATVTFRAIGTGESYIRSVGRYYMKSPNIEIHDSRWKPVIVISLYNSVTVNDSADTNGTMVLQNYPNPFNPETWIPYQLADNSELTIRIHNAAGQLIRILDLGYKKAGLYVTKNAAAYWDGTSNDGEHVPSGVYFYSIRAGEYSITRKMIIAQ